MFLKDIRQNKGYAVSEGHVHRGASAKDPQHTVLSRYPTEMRIRIKLLIKKTDSESISQQD